MRANGINSPLREPGQQLALGLADTHKGQLDTNLLALLES
jgi:hypothetical protein